MTRITRAALRSKLVLENQDHAAQIPFQFGNAKTNPEPDGIERQKEERDFVTEQEPKSPTGSSSMCPLERHTFLEQKSSGDEMPTPITPERQPLMRHFSNQEADEEAIARTDTKNDQKVEERATTDVAHYVMDSPTKEYDPSNQSTPIPPERQPLISHMYKQDTDEEATAVTEQWENEYPDETATRNSNHCVIDISERDSDHSNPRIPGPFESSEPSADGVISRERIANAARVKEERARAIKDANCDLYDETPSYDGEDQITDPTTVYAKAYAHCLELYTRRSFALSGLLIMNAWLLLLSSDHWLSPTPLPAAGIAESSTLGGDANIGLTGGIVWRGTILFSIASSIVLGIWSLSQFGAEGVQLTTPLLGKTGLLFFFVMAYVLDPGPTIAWSADQWFSFVLLGLAVADLMIFFAIVFAIWIRGGKGALRRQSLPFQSTLPRLLMCLGLLMLDIVAIILRILVG